MGKLRDFFEGLFAGRVVLVCDGCGTKYTLGRDTSSITSEEMASFGGPLLAPFVRLKRAASHYSAESMAGDKATILRVAPERGWECHACNRRNAWKG